MDMPGGMMRRVRSSGAGRWFCEIPAHVVPESPFEVALDLGFDRGESVHPRKEKAERDEHRAQALQCMSSPECEVTVSDTDCCSGAEVPGDARGEEDSGRGSRGPAMKDWGSRECEFGDGRLELLHVSESVGVDVRPGTGEQVELGATSHVDVGVGMDGMVDASTGEGRVSKCSVGCSPEGGVVPAKTLEATPVNFISAASYCVDRPSKPEPFRCGKSTTGLTSYCRIEASVIRSRSARPRPVRHQASMKSVAKSISADSD